MTARATRRWLSATNVCVLVLALGVVMLVTLSGPKSAEAVGAASAPRATAGIDENSDPLGPSSPVYAIIESNGRYYIGGDFQTVAGETQPYLAAIDVATGRLDPAFRPDLNGLVNTIAVTPDGSALYVGGKFSRIDNSYPSRLAKLDPVTGAVDNNFDPDASAAVETIVTDGTSVWAGGAFSTIGGVTQPFFARMDSSGIVDTSFDPVLDGKVLDLELHASQLYMGGNFTSIDGMTHERIAAVDPATGIADPWAPSSQFKIYDISVHPNGSLLYAAGAGSLSAGGNSLTAWDTSTGLLEWRRVGSGDFQALVATTDLVYAGSHGEFIYIDNNGPFLEDDANPNAIRRNKLAAFDPLTGALAAWNPGANSTWGVWSLDIGPSGLLIGGDFTTIAGQIQPHFAIFDGPGIGNQSPQPMFSYDCTGASCTFDATGSSDPDGTVVAYAWDFGDGRTASGAQATINFDPDARPTVSVTITDDAGATARTQNVVIVGDGLLDVELIGTAVANGQSAVISPELPVGISDGDLAVAFIAANDGAASITAPVGWTEVGSQAAGSMNSWVFTRPVDAVDAGSTQTFAFDQSWKADASIAVFRYADTTAPVAAYASEPESRLWGQHSAPSITTGVPSTVLHYWANRTTDSASLAGPGDEAVIIESVGVNAAHINATVALATTTGPGPTAERVAIGDVQTKSALGWSVAITELPQVPTCTAVANADDTVSLSWTDVRRATSYVVRTSDSYIATVGLALDYTYAPAPGTYDYVIRVRKSGITTDTSCSPQITIDPPPPFVQTCSAVLNLDESITLTWDDIPGEDNYTVRRNSSYVASVGNAGTYDDSPGEGTWDYVIRSRKSGITTDTSCSPQITIDPPPPFVQTCTATTNPDDTVTLVWDAIPGENSYQVRRNGAWLETTAALTYTDVFALAGDEYVIRSRLAGVTTNTICS